MEKVKPINALALILFAFTIGVFLTSYLTPSYAANPTTFFSCEVGGGGCSIRLNTTDHITLNSTVITYINQNVTFLQNATFINGNMLNMTFGIVAFHQSTLHDCDFGALHAICLEDHGNNGPSNFILEGGSIAAAQQTQIFLIPRLDDLANFEALRISGDGTTYSINIDEAGTGVLRPFVIEMDSVDLITFSITNTVDFNARNTSNVGNVGNDFLSSGNSLITTTFSGNVNGGNNAFTNLGAAGNDMGASNTFVGSSFDPSVSIVGAGGFEIIFTGGGSADVKVDAAGGSWGIWTDNGAAGDTKRWDVGGGAATDTITMQNANLAIPSNNTLSLFSDAVRIANIWSVVNTAKTQVTGLLLESDILPAEGESFITGDVVCLYKAYSFTKCSKDNDTLVLGPVYLLPERGITRYENETILMDGQLKTQLKGIWEDVSYKPMLVVEGPLKVKACGIIKMGQFLVAGAGGCAKGVDELTPSLRYFGIAAANSVGGWVEAYMP